MSHSCLVKCPQIRCGWSGRLTPSRDGEPWNGFEPTVIFECPACHQEWRVRFIGGQAEPLPMDESDDDLEAAEWPPLELGVGD